MSKKICCWLSQNGLSGFHIRNNGNMYPCVIRWINLTENKNQEHYIDYNHLSCEEIQELRLQFFDDINNGKHEECQNCPLLKEVPDEEAKLGPIKHLVYHPHTLCTLNCSYCFYTDEQRQIPIDTRHKDLYKTIKHFYDIGLLDKENFALDLGGGEPLLLDNLDKTIEFMSKTWKNPTLYLLSNSTVTQKVNELIQSTKNQYNNVHKVLVTSLDCGTAETYKKIRKKDCFYDVIENLYNYAENKIFDEMLLKYILLDDGSNTDDDNLYGFLRLCKLISQSSTKGFKVSIDVNWKERKHRDDKIPDNILKLIAKMRYIITDVMNLEYIYASDYLSGSTQQGIEAINKIEMFVEEYKFSNKCKRDIYEHKILSQGKHSLIPLNKLNKIASTPINNTISKVNIYIVTYNRKNFIERTLKQLLDINSPVKDYNITILDNCSTDGTSELIQEYCNKYNNLIHIRHNINIGGNANIARAFEMGATCGKEYFWVLGDDDCYDWTSWTDVEKAMNEKYDAIFTFPSKETNERFFYASLISGCLYKASIIDENVIENMYDNITNLFPHMAVIAKIFLDKKSIFSDLSKRIVNVRICENLYASYTRGLNNYYIPERRKNVIWLVCVFNTIELITDKKLRKEVLSSLRHGHESLFKLLYHELLIVNKVYRNDYWLNYLQVLRHLNLKQIIILVFAWLYITFNGKNYKFYDIQDESEWKEYLKVTNEQKYLDKLAKKLKNKKIIIYGAGLVSNLIYNNYDLSKLNIVGVADKKFERIQAEEWHGYKAYKPNDILNKADVILIGLKFFNNFEYKFKIKKKIKAKIYPLITINYFYPINALRKTNHLFKKINRYNYLSKCKKLENRKKLRNQNISLIEKIFA